MTFRATLEKVWKRWLHFTNAEQNEAHKNLCFICGDENGYFAGREHCRLRAIIIHSKYFPSSETQGQSVGPGEKARQKVFKHAHAWKLSSRLLTRPD